MACTSRRSATAKAAITTTPIVFYVGGDPVELGLVAGLNRPDGNLTGVTALASEVGPKRLEPVHELLPASDYRCGTCQPDQSRSWRALFARSSGGYPQVRTSTPNPTIGTASSGAWRQGRGQSFARRLIDTLSAPPVLPARLQRIEEAIVVATGAPRQPGCPPWVVLGVLRPQKHPASAPRDVPVTACWPSSGQRPYLWPLARR